MMEIINLIINSVNGIMYGYVLLIVFVLVQLQEWVLVILQV